MVVFFRKFVTINLQKYPNLVTLIAIKDSIKEVENFGEIGNTSVLYHKNRLPKELKSNIESFKKGIVTPPSTIQFSFDRTCNLKCPSCRINLIVENSKGIDRVKKTIDEIETQYGQTTKRL